MTEIIDIIFIDITDYDEFDGLIFYGSENDDITGVITKICLN